MFKTNATLGLMLTLGLLASDVAGATSAPKRDLPVLNEQPPPDSEEPDAIAKENQAAGQVDYEFVTFRKFVELFWRFGYLDHRDPAVVSEYIRYISCDVYKKYIDDDFKWPEVQKVTKSYLEKYSQRTEPYISVVQPIALGRYMPEKGWFAITGDTQYLNVVKLEIADFNNKLEIGENSKGAGDCEITEKPKTFPLVASVQFTGPFSLTYVPMDEELARYYLNYAEGFKNGITIKGAIRERPAFVNFRIKLTGATPPVRVLDPANFYGRLDGYDIYADREMKLRLYSWQNKRKN